VIDPVGVRAVNSLSIDIANLTSRLAITSAMIEQLIELADTIDQSLWSVQQVADHDVDAHVLTIPGTEADKLQQLLALLQSMK
jgi:hypothetical protein